MLAVGQVNPAVLGEVRVRCYLQQSALSVLPDLGNALDGGSHATLEMPQYAVTLGHQHRAAGQESNRPKHAFAAADFFEDVTVTGRSDDVAFETRLQRFFAALGLHFTDEDHHGPDLIVVHRFRPARHAHVGDAVADRGGHFGVAAAVYPFVVDQRTARTAGQVLAVTAGAVFIVEFADIALAGPVLGRGSARQREQKQRDQRLAIHGVLRVCSIIIRIDCVKHAITGLFG